MATRKDFRPYFTLHEFDSPDAPGSGKNMSATLLRMLNLARRIAGIPFVINSGYRTPQHNRLVGGVPGSAHTKGLAVDIRVRTPQEYKTILLALLKAGFKRIGLGRGFIHADIDKSKPYPAVWTYDDAGYNRLADRLEAVLKDGVEKKNTLRDYQYLVSQWFRF